MSTVAVAKPTISAEPASAPRKWLRVALVCFSIYLGAAYLLQRNDGAFRSEFGGHPDEAAHFVTGLMVHDYLANYRAAAPMSFAENYYLHYPKVALGHWPPVFYILQAAWMAVFSTSRGSLLVLIAVLDALIGLSLYKALRDDLGAAAAAIAGLTWVALPLVQNSAGLLMAEMPVTLFMFWATLCYAEYLSTGSSKASAAFGVLASLAILTKGNGLALAVVPPLSIAVTSRWLLVKRRSFWVPLLIVLVLCGPWYLWTRHMLQSTWEDPWPSVHYFLRAAFFYSTHMWKTTGPAVTLLLLVGLWTRFVRPLVSRKLQPLWAAAGALFTGVMLLNCVSTAGMDARFLMPAMPAGIMFAFAGVAYVVEKLGSGERQRRLAAAGSALLLVAVLVQGLRLPQKIYAGFDPAAEAILSRDEAQNAPVLISSDASGEGMFIAAFAEHDSRPTHMVLRASKVLGESDWMGREYRPAFQNTAQMQEFLEDVPVSIVVVDTSIAPMYRRLHHTMLEKLTSDSTAWQLLARYPVTRKGVVHPDALKVFRLTRAKPQPEGKVTVKVPLLDRTFQEVVKPNQR